MTTETNSVLNTVKEAFAPVTEAFTKLQNMEVPEAARDFVKKQAETAKVRAADFHAGSEKVTAVIAGREGSRPTLASLQDEARKHIAGYKVPRELHIVGEVPRAPSGKPDYGKLVTEGAKTAQDNFSKVYSKTA